MHLFETRRALNLFAVNTKEAFQGVNEKLDRQAEDHRASQVEAIRTRSRARERSVAGIATGVATFVIATTLSATNFYRVSADLSRSQEKIEKLGERLAAAEAENDRRAKAEADERRKREAAAKQAAEQQAAAQRDAEQQAVVQREAAERAKAAADRDRWLQAMQARADLMNLRIPR